MTADALVHMPIADLKPYERNARTHPRKQLDLLKRSLTEFGFTNPVLIDREANVIAGHGRIEAAREMGWDAVPVVRLDDLTPDQVRAYRLADNRIAEMSGWDDEALEAEFAALRDVDFDLDLTGFDAADVHRLLGANEEETETPEPPADPVTRLGDVWVMGGHRLICGDSTDAATVARVLAGATPRLMVTDPPYGVEYDESWRRPYQSEASIKRTGRVQNDDQADWGGAWALSPASVFYVWHGFLHGATIVDGLPQAEFRAQIIWRKLKINFSRSHYHWQHETCIYAVRKGAKAGWIGDRKQSTVWDIGAPQQAGGKDEDRTPHSTQKPLECMERPIRNHKGDVYEPFAGSGTTFIAAENQSRRCFGIEIDPGYCDVIVERWQNHTGGKAEREAG